KFSREPRSPPETGTENRRSITKEDCRTPFAGTSGGQRGSVHPLRIETCLGCRLRRWRADGNGRGATVFFPSWHQLFPIEERLAAVARRFSFYLPSLLCYQLVFSLINHVQIASGIRTYAGSIGQGPVINRN